MIEQALIDRFISLVGEKHALTAKDDLTHYTHENRHIYVGQTPLVLKPGSTAEAAAIMKLAFETDTAIVPQGGHTGHAAGAVPDENGSQIVLATERLNKIREIDLAGNTMTVEAGVVLQTIQETADDNDRLFPLSLGSQGSCMIGGNISSNAGGTGVLAYGNTRELVLGLEVVLPNGDIWNGLRKLKKDNTGYALKHLFIGAEGTLGVVTAAVLKLFPKPKGRVVVWAGVSSPSAASKILNSALPAAGSNLTGFELIHRTPLDFVLQSMPGSRDPLAGKHEWYVLAEFSSGRSEPEAREQAETIFADVLERGLAHDAVISGSLAEFAALWKLREDMGEAQTHHGASIKHDISVPVHRIPDFLEKAGPEVMRVVPGARLCVFGHLGDGNLHYNVSQPVGGDAQAFLEKRHEVNAAVHAIIAEMGGSISAEHGIGRLKRDLLAHTKSPVEMAMMRSVKQALDPKGIMNPGKVV